jgi:hypothetical protein
MSSSVDPFQLAYTTEPPAGFTRAATAGLSAGWPVSGGKSVGRSQEFAEMSQSSLNAPGRPRRSTVRLRLA